MCFRIFRRELMFRHHVLVWCFPAWYIEKVWKVTLHIVDLWQYRIWWIRSGYECTLFMVLQCGLHAVHWSLIEIFIPFLAAEPGSSAELLLPSLYHCGTILLTLYSIIVRIIIIIIIIMCCTGDWVCHWLARGQSVIGTWSADDWHVVCRWFTRGLQMIGRSVGD